jgi:hypothetical protein
MAPTTPRPPDAPLLGQEGIFSSTTLALCGTPPGQRKERGQRFTL